MKSSLNTKLFILYIMLIPYYYDCRYFSQLFQNKGMSTPSMYEAVLCSCVCVFFKLLSRTILLQLCSDNYDYYYSTINQCN